MAVEPWKRIEPTVVTKFGYRDMVMKTFAVPGKAKTLEFATYLAEGTQSASVIALTPENLVIVARQFRHGPERIMDELPGGMVDAGEDIAAAARRELLEETGYEPGQLEFLGQITGDAYSNGVRHYFFATNCTPATVTAEPDEDEQIEVRLMPIAKFIDTAKHDGMTDPGAVLLVYDKLQRLL